MREEEAYFMLGPSKLAFLTVVIWPGQTNIHNIILITTSWCMCVDDPPLPAAATDASIPSYDLH